MSNLPYAEAEKYGALLHKSVRPPIAHMVKNRNAPIHGTLSVSHHHANNLFIRLYSGYDEKPHASTGPNHRIGHLRNFESKSQFHLLL
jgi:hypothetical protein